MSVWEENLPPWCMVLCSFCLFLVGKSLKSVCFLPKMDKNKISLLPWRERISEFFNTRSLHWGQMSFIPQTLRKIWEIACPWVGQSRKYWLLMTFTPSTRYCTVRRVRHSRPFAIPQLSPKFALKRLLLHWKTQELRRLRPLDPHQGIFPWTPRRKALARCALRFFALLLKRFLINGAPSHP